MDDPLKADADDNPFIAPVVELENSHTAGSMELDPDEVNDQWWSKFDHDRSLCIFSAQNCFRLAILRLVVSKVFNNLILVLIVLNTLEMSINCEDYFATDSTGHKIFDVFDYVVNIVFTVELCLRVVALGLYFSPGAYLQYNTYRLDFLVVAFAWLDEALTGFPNLKALRIVRALRALKSLRFMNQVMAVMDSVEAAIPLLKNVAVLFLFLIALFSIMGTQLLAGTLRTRCVSVSTGLEMINNEYGSKACTNDAYITYDRGRIPGFTLGQNTNGFKCPAGFACIPADNPNDGYTSFDNIPMACFTIFQVASLEGWTSLAYQASDGLAKSVVLYFLAIIIFFSYFTFQLFTAVMFLTFAKIREQADMVLERDEFAVDRALAAQPLPKKPPVPDGLQIALNWTLNRGVSNVGHDQVDEAADEMNAEMIADWGNQSDRGAHENGNDVMYEQSEVSPLSYLTNEAAVTNEAASSSDDGSAADGEGSVDIVEVDPDSPRLLKLTSTTPLESPRVVRTSCAAAASAVLPPISHRRVSLPVPTTSPTSPVSSPPTVSPSAMGERSISFHEQSVGESEQEIPWEPTGETVQEAPTASLALTVGGENNAKPSAMKQWLGEDCDPSWGPSARSTDGSFILDHETDTPADNATTIEDDADTVSAARSGAGSGASVAPDDSSPNPLRDPVSAKSDTVASCSPAQRGVGFGASVAPDNSSPNPLRDRLHGGTESDQQRPVNRRSSRFTRREDVRRPSQMFMTGGGQRSRRNSGSMDVSNFPCLQEWREEMESNYPSIPGCLWSLWYHADPMISTDSDPPSLVICDGVPVFDNPVGHLITNFWYMNFINISILLNVIIISMSYHKEPGWWTSMLEWAEVGFFCIFMAEMVLKCIGFGGLKWYFTNNSNVFDFCIILVSIPFSFSVIFSYSFPNLTIFRLFRLARLLRTFRFLRSLGEIIDVVTQAGKAIANLLVFMTISYIIVAIFMMQLMSRKIPEEASRNNFDCFGQSLLTLFVVMSGEDWNSVMYATWEASTMGGICVLLWFFFSNFILLNMFAAIILENFALSHLEKIQLQVMVYMNDKEKRFVQGNLEKQMEALRRVSINEKVEFVPDWEKVDFQKEHLVMKTWEENQLKGMSRDEREEYLDFLRLRADDDDEERLDQLSDQYVKHEESPYYNRMNKHRAKKPAEEQALITSNSWFKNTPTQVAQAVAAPTSTDKTSLRNKAMTTAPVRDLKLRVLEAKKTRNPQEIAAAKEALELEIKTQVKKAIHELTHSFSSENDPDIVTNVCFWMGVRHPIRRFCYKIARHPAFEWIVIFVILVSSILLAIEPAWDADSTVVAIVVIADPIILGFFTLEMVLKIIAFG